MKRPTKAVITAAGLGTRMLPAAKAVPKEMLPIVDKPAIQYLVEEAAAAGIKDILVITGREKSAIENHFDFSPEYEQRFREKDDEKSERDMRAIANLANIHYIRQKQPLGLGHAVLCARSFVGDEPFVVMYGDDVIIGEVPAAGELIDMYEKYSLPVAAVKSVSREDIGKYCSLRVDKLAEGEYRVWDMVEKPSPEQIMSQLAILGRVLLTPEIFPILEKTKPGAKGEIQLTDAMSVLAKQSGMTAVEFSGTRYDMGSKLGSLIANVEQGLKHPEIGEEFRAFLKEICSKL
ncbi:MAG: UTP--glucose-1-phosphate uridylyltransferase [Eubacteriales bacterium]